MRRSIRLLSCVGALAGLLASRPAVAGPPSGAAARTVLTIHQGAPSFPANLVVDPAIRDALLARVTMPIDYFAEYLESETLPPDQAAQALADYMRRKYLGRRIDLVIAITDQCLAFARAHRADLFPGAPIVYMGLATPDAEARADGPGLTGVRVGTAYGQTLSTALALHPGTEQVFVIANSPNRPGVAVVRDELRAASSGVRLTFLEEMSVPRLLQAVKAAPPRSLVLYIWHAQLEPGNLLYSDRIAQMVAAASPVPVYGTSDFYVGLGLVGGVTRKTRETGNRVGDIAGRLLNGEHARDIPIETAQLAATFDWRQLRRWGIDEARLPAGSDVQFRVPTAWELYRRYIIGTLAVVSAQLLLIAALVAARARARRAEATVRTRETTLRASYDRIRQLAGRLIHAQETTRASIARDLHDGVCQDLAGLAAAVGTLKKTSGAIQDSAVQEELSKIQDETRGTYDQMRQLSHDLHPLTLQLLGLATALKAHCAEVEKRHGVAVRFAVDGDIGRFDPDVAVSLFRIAQESLRNGVVHGKAGHLAVTLTRSDDRIELTVSDDGAGFDVESMRRSGSGLGLVSMDERAHAFGGDVQVESRPGNGTTIRVRYPAGPRAAITAAAG